MIVFSNPILVLLLQKLSKKLLITVALREALFPLLCEKALNRKVKELKSEQ